ncbi:MAG TPA: glycosyltransferase family 4 protein [Steroidobacteraceae bacterium]|nr:glycosyltransferase family 4 protein [Steroidobacteraceae bacterium]
MRTLLYICEEWPNPYKPTWDFQIQSLRDLGLDVFVVQCGDYLSKQYEQWGEKGESLAAVPRFSYPSTLRDIPKHLRNGAFVWRLFARLGYLPCILGQSKPIKERLLDYLRLCALPKLQYDYVLVKNLNCAADYSWLPTVVRTQAMPSVYYHGGAVVGVDSWYLRHRQSFFGNFGAFLTNTRYSKSELEGLGCLSSKIHVVPVGLKMDLPSPTRTEYRRAGILRIFSACRLSEEKGVIYAIQAIESLVESGVTNIKYDIVGNGLEEARLREYVRKHNLGQWIELHGRKPNTEINERFLTHADVFLNTSYPTESWAENQCIAIQEAGLARVPAIASNCGGLPEVVVDGETGLLVEVKSLASIAAAIKSMAEMSPAEIARMGLAAEQFARRNFEVATVTKKLVELMRGGDMPLVPDNSTGMRDDASVSLTSR